MIIEHANKQDITDIMELVEKCINHLEMYSIHQWNEYYPTHEHVSASVHDKTLFKLVDQKILIGTVSVTSKQPIEYGKIEWKDISGKFVVITKLMVSPEFQKMGCATKLMDFAEYYALAKNYSSIRLDAYTGNPRAIKLYEARGYKRRGHTMFPTRELSFYCYEKLL